MIQAIPLLVEAIPHIYKLFTSDNKSKSALELTKEVASALGVENDKKAIIDHLEANPDAHIKLKELELKAKELLIKDKEVDNKLTTDTLLIQANEYESARNMQKEALKQEDKFSKRFIHYLTIFWSVSSVIYIFCITFVEIPQTSIRVVDTITGFLLGTIIATIVGFYYGNSIKANKK